MIWKQTSFPGIYRLRDIWKKFKLTDNLINIHKGLVSGTSWSCESIRSVEFIRDAIIAGRYQADAKFAVLLIAQVWLKIPHDKLYPLTRRWDDDKLIALTNDSTSHSNARANVCVCVCVHVHARARVNLVAGISPSTGRLVVVKLNAWNTCNCV